MTGPVVCQVVAGAGFGLIMCFDPFDCQGDLVSSQFLADLVEDGDENRVLEQ
jgi:hypothetical protein